MATCRDCFHDYICFNSNGETKYYGKDICCNNVEQLCRKYKQKPKLPLTCKDCLHNDACTDMLEALGFRVDGDGLFADKRCRMFKNKNSYAEVVRCEECQSWDTKHCSDGQGWCPKVCGYRYGGWFCAAGKRKTITDQTMKALEAMDKNAHGGADD